MYLTSVAKDWEITGLHLPIGGMHNMENADGSYNGNTVAEYQERIK